MNPFEEEEILRAFAIVKKTFPYKDCNTESAYIVDGKIVGIGYTCWKIDVKPDWHVVRAYFATPQLYAFNKFLLLYDDKKSNRFNRCHAMYVDSADKDKNGGSNTSWHLHEIFASLMHHAMTNDESTCIGCAGKDPLQTHYIHKLGPGK